MKIPKRAGSKVATGLLEWPACCLFFGSSAAVAQSVEQRIRNAKVTSSIPVSGTTYPENPTARKAAFAAFFIFPTHLAMQGEHMLALHRLRLPAAFHNHRLERKTEATAAQVLEESQPTVASAGRQGAAGAEAC
jgi:hypothetical protein